MFSQSQNRSWLRALLFVACLGLGVFGCCGEVRAAWWLQAPSGYTGIGGASNLGPYSTWYEASNVNNQYFNGQGTITGYNDDAGGGASSGGGGANDCAVVTIYNRTGSPVSYSIQVNGQWQSITVSPNGGWHYHWHYPPKSFPLVYDYSDAAGMQKKSQSLSYNKVTTSGEPSASDGRAYEFYTVDGLVGFGPAGGARTSPVSSTHSLFRRAGARDGGTLDGSIGSIIGEGHGTANSAADPTSAEGSFSLSAITPKGGEYASGTWTASRRSHKPAGGFRREAVSDWLFRLKLDGAEFETEVKVRGGAGDSESFSIVFPCNRGPDQRVRIRFDVQFSGDAVRLLTFRKAG